MQEKYSPITQSRFENICSSHVILTQKVFLTLLSSVSAEDTNSTVIFVQSSSLFKILCKHSMHIHTVNIFYIYICIIFIYISIEHDFPQVMAVLSHTHILSRRQNQTQKTTALLLTLSDFFFLKNAQHLPLNYLYSVTVRVKYHVIYKLI